MKLLPHVFLLIALAVAVGCVREASHQELTELIARYEMNTVVTTVYYSGSDETFDYFYLDVPLGRNKSIKVRSDDVMMKRRFPMTRDREQWALYRPNITNAPSNRHVIISSEENPDD